MGGGGLKAGDMQSGVVIIRVARLSSAADSAAGLRMTCIFPAETIAVVASVVAVGARLNDFREIFFPRYFVSGGRC